jgi:hypothetical protein
MSFQRRSGKESLISPGLPLSRPPRRVPFQDNNAPEN